MAQRQGYEGKLMYKVGGVGAGGSWMELSNARDVNFSLDANEVDASTRASGGYKITVPGQKDASVEFEMIWDTEDAGFIAIKNAFFSGAKIGIRPLDAEDGQGLEADFCVTSFSRNEPLDGVMTVSVTLKPTYSTNPPQWIGD